MTSIVDRWQFFWYSVRRHYDAKSTELERFNTVESTVTVCKGMRRQRAAHPVSQVSRRRELARDLRRDLVVRRQRHRAAET